MHALDAPDGVERDGIEQDFQLDASRETKHPIDGVARGAVLECPRDPVVQHQLGEVVDPLGHPAEL